MLDDDWRLLPPGAVGEVAVRGPSVIDGYRDNPAANEASFRDGWFRTGDSGTLSADGYLTLEGRIKELINRGGEKISPHEVEEVLLAHPAVAEAVAYAAPDEKYGERRRGRGRAPQRGLRRGARGVLRRAARGLQGPGLDRAPRRDPEGADRQDPTPAPGGAGRHMRIAVLGAGAIGAYVGAALARGGADVHLVARGANLEALRGDGVRC